MNTRTKKITAVSLCVLLLSAVCLAAGTSILSPALYLLENKINMKKCGVVNTDVAFSAADFDDVLRSKPDFIKITELPDPAVGTLRINELAISKNQLIARDDFSKLVFSPMENTTGNAAFRFESASSGQKAVSVNCTVYVLDEVNLAPAVGSQSIATSENIAAFKFLRAADPEGDAMVFEILSYPAHGSVRLSDDSSGYFCYAPAAGYTGKDSFEYTVCDEYGNRSKPCKVNITVNKPVSGVYFDDMSEHWAHGAAVRIASKGLMPGSIDAATGETRFEPEQTVSRGDFLAMALISAGKESDVSFVTETVFADDAEIPVNIKSYAAYAKANGIVSGYSYEDGTTVFASTEPITRAEAAVVVDRILALPNAKTAEMSVFTDCAAIPSWAERSMANLTACGIFNGTGYGEIQPESVLTRAETAEILCNVETYLNTAERLLNR